MLIFRHEFLFLIKHAFYCAKKYVDAQISRLKYVEWMLCVLHANVLNYMISNTVLDPCNLNFIKCKWINYNQGHFKCKLWDIMWGKHVQISKITITLFAKSRTSKKKCFEFTELEHQNVALTLVCYKCIACAVRNKVPLIFFCLFLFSHSLSGRQVDAVLPRHFTAIYYRCVDRVKESEDLTFTRHHSKKI